MDFLIYVFLLPAKIKWDGDFKNLEMLTQSHKIDHQKGWHSKLNNFIINLNSYYSLELDNYSTVA